MFGEALGLLDHHLGDGDVARCRLVEGRGNDFAAHRALHVGDFLGTLVDEQHDQIALGVIFSDRLRNVLQQNGFAGTGRRHDQRALAFADRRDDVDDAARTILLGRILGLHVKPFVRIERGEVVERHLVARTLGIFEVYRRNADEGEVTLAVARTTDCALDSVAGAQAHLPDHLRLDVDIVRSGQVVGLRRTQEAETVRQDLDHAHADDFDIAFGQLLEDAEHQFLLRQERGAFDLELFRHGQQFGRCLFLEIVEQHALVLLLSRFDNVVRHWIDTFRLWFAREMARGAGLADKF